MDISFCQHGVCQQKNRYFCCHTPGW